MLFQSNLIDGFITHGHYGHNGTFGTLPNFFLAKNTAEHGTSTVRT